MRLESLDLSVPQNVGVWILQALHQLLLPQIIINTSICYQLIAINVIEDVNIFMKGAEFCSQFRFCWETCCVRNRKKAIKFYKQYSSCNNNFILINSSTFQVFNFSFSEFQGGMMTDIHHTNTHISCMGDRRIVVTNFPCFFAPNTYSTEVYLGPKAGLQLSRAICSIHSASPACVILE
jgi:hypothetical protein